METVFNVVKYGALGFFGLIVLLIVVAAFFGKRIIKKWEIEAEFRDADGREFGEFEVELSRIDKKEPDYTLKAKFHMRHPALTRHATVQVYIEDTLVFEQRVEKEGRLHVMRSELVNPVGNDALGKTCRVVVGSTEIASAEFHPD